jgi:hypothetical protein
MPDGGEAWRRQAETRRRESSINQPVSPQGRTARGLQSASTPRGCGPIGSDLRPWSAGVTVTEVKNGTIVQKTGSSILVRTDQGFKSFSQGDIDTRGVKIMRDGKAARIDDLSNGDHLSATIITSKPPRVLTEKEVQATLAPSGRIGDWRGGGSSGGGGTELRARSNAAGRTG